MESSFDFSKDFFLTSDEEESDRYNLSQSDEDGDEE